MSVMTSRKSRLKQMAATSKRAAKALELSEKPESFLSTVQIGITVIGVLTGYLGGEALGEAFAGWIQGLMPGFAYAGNVGTTLAVSLITFITLIFGELVPKRLALTRSEAIAGLVAMPMSWLARLALPFVWLLSKTTQLVLRLFGLGKDEVASVTEEEIRMLVAESHEAGVIDAHERDMMNRVMRLGDRTADSLMTPRNRIAWLDTQAGLERNLEIMAEHEFSRYPVYRDNDMDVVGVLELKSLATRMARGDNALFQTLREPLYVSESTHAMKLLEIFREEQQSMALVVDEYGEIQGLVTISDLMGAVVGRLQAVRELIGSNDLPDAEDGDYYTLAGMCIHYFGRIPHAGEYFDWAGWRFEVVDLDGARVDKLLLRTLSDEQADELTA